MRFTLFFLLSFFLFSNLHIKAQSNLVAGKSFQKDSLLIDIQILQKALTEIHPGIYRYNSPASIEQIFDKLRSQLYDGITEAELLKRLAQTTAQFRCGHTYANPWNMEKEIRDRLFGGAIYFPLGFKIIDNQFIVTHNASEDSNIKRGAQIKQINGIPVQEIIDSLSTVVKLDGHNEAPIPKYLSLQNFTTRHWSFFDLYFPIFFPMEASKFTVQYQNYGEGEVRQVELTALGKQARQDKMVAHYGAEVLSIEGWSFEVLNSDLAVIRLGTFAIWNWKDFDPGKWFADAFHQLDSLQIPNLIIDIRGNGGGLSEPRDQLLSYLIKEPLECEGLTKILIRTTKVDPSLVPYCDTWVKPILEGLPKEYYSDYNENFYELKEDSGCSTVVPKEKAFQGQTYIFGDASNVSATFNLLYRANKKGFAKYVGAPSGGNQQGINGGEYIFFRLPYSKMEVDIPLKFFANQGNPEDAGVKPQIEIKPTQKDIAEGIDPNLAYVLKKIKHK